MSNLLYYYQKGEQKMKLKAIAILITLCLSFSLVSCGVPFLSSVEDAADSLQSNIGFNNVSNELEFYTLVCESQDLLDTLADAIYQNWYDCIYNDKFLEDINIAIYSAFADYEDEVNILEINNEAIKESYKAVRDGKYSSEVKAVMQSYNEYYSFVVDVSGSYETYSANKETYKKALDTALRNLSFEIE